MPVLTRRRFLSGTATALAAPTILRSVPAFAATDGFTELRAAPTTAQLVPPQYGRTDVWAFGGSIPGPEIRVRAGERVRRRFVNGLPQTSAVHWHGIRLDNAMDGAAGLTQEPVQPGATFDYDFAASDPGTYWYHSHDRSWEQMARGLSGPLIVEDAEPWMGLEGAATRELTLMLDDWYLGADAKIDEDSFGALHEWAHAGRIGNTFTVNGTMDPVLPVRAGERLRLRLINAANARIMPVRVGDDTDRARLIALDGHPAAPRDSSEGVVLTPAQRADLVIDCTAEPGARVPLLVDRGQGEWIEVATLAYSDEPALPIAGADVRPLPGWAHERSAALDLANAQRETLVMEGGAMGSLARARLGGVDYDFRELVAKKRVWAFNGVAGFADREGGGYSLEQPAFRVERGRTVHLTIRNDTGFPHGIHLHGHHFTVLSRNGEPDPHRDRRDTVLTERGRRGRDRLRGRQSRQVAHALPYARASGGGHVELVRGRVTGILAPLAIGVVLGLGAIGLLRWTGMDRDRSTGPITLTAIALFYVAFAIENGDAADIAIHTAIAGLFVGLAVLGHARGLALVGVAMIGHGLFDVAMAFVEGPAPEWWTPFCLGVDVVLGVWLIAFRPWERGTGR